MPDNLKIPKLNAEVRFQHTAQNHPSEPPESCEILSISVDGHKLDESSMVAWLVHVRLYYDPRLSGVDAKYYTVKEIIDFEICKYILECESDREFEKGRGL